MKVSAESREAAGNREKFTHDHGEIESARLWITAPD